MKHLGILDSMRGIAILMVFAFHCMYWSHGKNQLPWDGWHRDTNQSFDFLLLIPVSWGKTGVAIFFVISGFCIHLSHSRSNGRNEVSGRKRWASFFIRRFWRIYPPYLAALALFTTTDILTGQITTFADFLEQGWTHLLLIHNFWPDTYMAINPSFWSIAVEAQLYVLYPILYGLALRLGWKIAIGITFGFEVGLGFFGFYSPISPHETFRFLVDGPLAYWFSWGIGAWIAEAWKNGQPLPLRNVPLFLVILFFGASWFIRVLNPLFFCAAAILAAVVLVRYLRVESPKTLQCSKGYFSRILAFIGSISYSFYLFHQPIISICNKMLVMVIGHGRPIWMFVFLIASIIPVVVLSWFSYRWLEIPSIAIGKSIVRRV